MKKKGKKKMSPPPAHPATERKTEARPPMQRAAPKNCLTEYRVPRTIHVRIMAHGIVQHSNKVTLVIVEYWHAFITAFNMKRNISNFRTPFTKVLDKIYGTLILLSVLKNKRKKYWSTYCRVHYTKIFSGFVG